MLYECQNAICRVEGVEHLRWGRGTFTIEPRGYSALAYRVRGTATITVDGNSYFVNVGDVLYLPQGVAYTAEYSDTELLVIHFRTVGDDTKPEVYGCDNAQAIYNAFLSAHIAWQEKAPGFEARVYAQLYAVLATLCENKMARKLPECFVEAVSYIHAKYTEPDLTVPKICQSAGIGATNLRALFQKYYQKTPTEYITKLRLERARNFISCGMSVEQAAVRSGFADPKYFARVVKKHFACTPRELRLYAK